MEHRRQGPPVDLQHGLPLAGPLFCLQVVGPREVERWLHRLQATHGYRTHFVHCRCARVLGAACIPVLACGM